MPLTFANDTQKFTLYAVNILLQTINELPLDNDEDLAASMEGQVAQSVLEETKKSVLSDGWDINLDENYSFSPDLDGYIAIPANVLDISSADGDLVNRGFRLYSRANQSHKFTEAVLCDVLWDIDFNDLPHAIRHFITIKAARNFQARIIGDTNQFSFSERDMEEAYLAARRSEGRTGRYNILTSGTYGAENLIG